MAARCYDDGGPMADENSTAPTKNENVDPMPARDDALAIPKWPDLASQFASACQHRIELLIKDSAHFDASILLADAKASTLLDAATAKAIRDGEIAAEARATAIAIALRVGALFAELYRLVGQDGAAEFFDAMAERARDGVYQSGPSGRSGV
jgi:hypothetical protein